MPLIEGNSLKFNGDTVPVLIGGGERVTVSGTEPTSPAVGDVWIDTSSAPGGGITDHGALDGLSDDDHPQYAKKAGDTFAGGVTFSSAVWLNGVVYINNNVNMSQNILEHARIQDYTEVCLVATGISGSHPVSLSTANVHDLSLTGATTFSFADAPTSGRAGSLTMIVRQPASAVAITWPASVKWLGGSPPSMGDSEIWICTFITRDAGSEWLGSAVGPFS